MPRILLHPSALYQDLTVVSMIKMESLQDATKHGRTRRHIHNGTLGMPPSTVSLTHSDPRLYNKHIIPDFFRDKKAQNWETRRSEAIVVDHGVAEAFGCA